jgi:hypothetical protein
VELTCLFCHRATDRLRRGLCGACYQKPRIKKLFLASRAGNRNSQSKVTEPVVLSIRRRCAAGESQSSVARSVGLTPDAVWRIVKGLNWGHVKDRLLPADSPTSACPGTEEKIRVLEARVAAGMELWHPEDFVEPAIHSSRRFRIFLERGEYDLR